MQNHTWPFYAFKQKFTIFGFKGATALIVRSVRLILNWYLTQSKPDMASENWCDIFKDDVEYIHTVSQNLKNFVFVVYLGMVNYGAQRFANGVQWGWTRNWRFDYAHWYNRYFASVIYLAKNFVKLNYNFIFFPYRTTHAL